MSVSLIQSLDGKPSGLVAIAHEISQHKKTDTELGGG